MKFYKALMYGRYIVTQDEAPELARSEIHPRDLPETGILGTAYNAGFSDGMKTAQTGWQVAREQLIAERDALCDDNKSLTIQRDALATSRDKAVSASQHIENELKKEKQYHLAAIMQRNYYRTELDREREEVADLRRSLSNVCADRDRLQETVEELKEQNTDLLRCVDSAQVRDWQLNESLDRVVAQRDNFAKQLHAELATVYSGSKGYAQGLNNGKGYAYTEISNHCRKLRAKLPGEY